MLARLATWTVHVVGLLVAVSFVFPTLNAVSVFSALRPLEPLDRVLQDPAPEVVVRELGDFSVLTDVRFWIAPPSKRESVVAAGRVLETLNAALADAGVDLPYPTQRVLLSEGSSADG